MIAPTTASPIESRIVLIDDDPAIHALVSAMLKPLGATIVSAMSGEEGLDVVRHQTPDLVLLDNDMPGARGIEVLQWIKEDAATSIVPVIMATGSESNGVLSSCFAAGAVDYIRKPFTAAELRARVSSVLDRQRMLGELTTAARMDRLTGLANRSLLSERLARALERSVSEADYSFTLMFLDFDRFKLVNDSLGHDVGDLLLKSIADRLRSNLRSTDSSQRDAPGNTVARIGGDEFVVLLDGIGTPNVANVIADRLLGVLAAPYQIGEHLVRSSASIGIVHSGDGYVSADEMLRDADIAMYEAKATGKGRHVAFTASMRDAVRDRIEIEADLRDAIGTCHLHLVFQPIVDLETRRVTGAEALVRWTHPTRGNIPPSVFIPIAEETGLILPLSDFILRESCSSFVRWHAELGDDAPRQISVNLSRVQLTDASLVSRTVAVLAEHGMQPGQLQLEVTESQIMQQRTAALELLGALRSEGIRLAMDDFGTGYSSLSCLQEFPLDVLKVDRSFVVNAGKGRDFAALLHAVVSLADNLGLKVVAEGIETDEQLVLLQALGCAFGQGYLLARPMSSEALIAHVGAAQPPTEIATR